MRPGPSTASSRRTAYALGGVGLVALGGALVLASRPPVAAPPEAQPTAASSSASLPAAAPSAQGAPSRPAQEEKKALGRQTLEAPATPPPAPGWAPQGARWGDALPGGKAAHVEALAVTDEGVTIVVGRQGDDEAFVQAYGPQGEGRWQLRPGKGRISGVDAQRGGEHAIVLTGDLAVAQDSTQPPRETWVWVLDKEGNERWHISLGNHSEQVRAVFDPSGGIVVVQEAPREDKAEHKKLKILAVGEGGKTRWQRDLGAPGATLRLSSLTCTPGGSVILGASGTGPFRLEGTLIPGGEERGLVVSLREGGAVAWVKPLGERGGFLPRVHVARARQEEVWVASDRDTGEKSAFDRFSEVAIQRLDARGQVVFERAFGPDASPEGATATADGGLVVSGDMAGAIDLGKGHLRNDGGGFVMQLDAEGKAVAAGTTGPMLGRVAAGSCGGISFAGDAGVRSNQPPTEAFVVGFSSPLADLAADVVPAPAPPRRSIFQFFKTTEERDGLTGKVLLARDHRIETEDTKNFGCFYWMSRQGLGPKFDSPPLNAAVQLVDERGETRSTLSLTHPLARIDVWKLYDDDRPTYAVVENDSICAGSWRGEEITLVEARGGKLSRLVATRAGGAESSPIVLRVGMRGDVRIVPARGGHGKDIHYARSGFTSGGGRGTRLVRLSQEGGRWVWRERSIEAEWMFDGKGGENSFPGRDQFPLRRVRWPVWGACRAFAALHPLVRLSAGVVEAGRERPCTRGRAYAALHPQQGVCGPAPAAGPVRPCTRSKGATGAGPRGPLASPLPPENRAWWGGSSMRSRDDWEGTKS